MNPNGGIDLVKGLCEKKKIGIIGAGSVGSTVAFVLTTASLVDEIVLVDQNEARARGEALDISHCIPFVSPMTVRAGDYEDIADADLIIVAASIPMLNLKSRQDLLQKNIPIVKEISENLKKIGFDGILLILSNPVDILSYLFYKLTGLPTHKVIGSGTVLDTARLRYLLGTNCGVDPRSIHVYILGEHGENEIPIWSQANIAGTPLKAVCTECNHTCDSGIFDKMSEKAKVSGYFIAKGKGETNYAIAMSTLSIVRAIFRDENRVLPVSSLMDGYLGIKDIFMSVPTIVNRDGAKGTIKLRLNRMEKEAFLRFSKMIKEEIAGHRIWTIGR